MYGLKPVPFIHRVFPQAEKPVPSRNFSRCQMGYRERENRDGPPFSERFRRSSAYGSPVGGWASPIFCGSGFNLLPADSAKDRYGFRRVLSSIGRLRTVPGTYMPKITVALRAKLHRWFSPWSCHRRRRPAGDETGSPIRQGRVPQVRPSVPDFLLRSTKHGRVCGFH
jgi:hypothetical protein